MSDKSPVELKEMAVRGEDFRDHYEFEMYGEPVVAVLKPLVDEEYLPLAGALADHLDVDEEEIDKEELTKEAKEEVEEARTEDGSIDMAQLDDEFVAIMQKAAVWGLQGSLVGEDEEFVEYEDEEERASIIGKMMGGYSVEIGSEVLEMSGDVRDATRFRGSRGSVSSSRSE